MSKRSSKGRRRSDPPRQRRRRPSPLRIALGVLAAVVCLGLMLLMREVRTAPSPPGEREPGRAETDPLTDVAGRSLRGRSMPALGRDAEKARREAIERGQKVTKPAPYVLPSDMPNPKKPPQWTKPRALPGKPKPPDPFMSPAIEQDPDRGRRGNAPN